MTESIIVRLFESEGLGEVLFPIAPVSGGFLHRMYKVRTAMKSYAVKHLNPEIMRRPDAAENYRRAEKLEQIIAEAGIPVVPALMINGRKMLESDGEYFYVFPWQDGQITDWNHISALQCRQAGNIQGRIHALQPRRTARTDPVVSAVDWTGYISEAVRQQSEIAAMLRESEQLLNEAQDALNKGRLALPDIECITDEDMDPKNVMWNNSQPVVIDLECLDYGNPVSHALQLSLQWAGVTTCSLDPDKQKAFFEGYFDAYDNGFRDYTRVLGLAYTWIEWLEFNVRRALGQCHDERELELGAQEVRNTINRIRYIREMESRIRRQLDRLFDRI